MIPLKFRVDELKREQSHDTSMDWYPRLDSPDEYGENSEEYLVQALTAACCFVFSHEPERIQCLDDLLRQENWKIFERLRMFLYARFPTEQTRPWIREFILTYHDYSEDKYHFEFQRMARVACEQFGESLLSKAERETIFNKIQSGPSEAAHREFMGDRFTEEGFRRRTLYFRKAQYRPLESILFGSHAQYYQYACREDAHVITDDSYPPNIIEEARVGEEHSPVPTEELAKFSDEELLGFINTCNAFCRDGEKWWSYISLAGLSGAFHEVFKDTILNDEIRYAYWMDSAAEIKRPTFIREIGRAP